VGRFAEHDAVELLGGPVAPLPGTIAAVEVAAGDHVAPGDTLVVLEAMKMEHRITADRDAVVEHVAVAAGDRVEAGDALVTFRDVEDEPPGDG
jgi:biotin carboxyl carrier protein